MVLLKIENSLDYESPRLIKCDSNSVESIVTWYGGYHAGDPISVHIDGVKQRLTIDHEIVNEQNEDRAEDLNPEVFDPCDPFNIK